MSIEPWCDTTFSYLQPRISMWPWHQTTLHVLSPTKNESFWPSHKTTLRSICRQDWIRNNNIKTTFFLISPNPSQCSLPKKASQSASLAPCHSIISYLFQGIIPLSFQRYATNALFKLTRKPARGRPYCSRSALQRQQRAGSIQSMLPSRD